MNGGYFGAPAFLLSQEKNEHRERQTGKAEEVEGPTPTKALSDPAAQKKCETAANGNSRRVNTLHGCAHARRKIIAKQRKRRRSESGLADANHQTAKEHRPEAFGESGQAG